MSKRHIGYAVVAMLLVAGLVVTYFVTRDSEQVQAESQPTGSVRFNWADGTELKPRSGSEKLLVEQAKRELDAVGIDGEVLAGKQYIIDLTVDRAAQELGERIVAEAIGRQPGNLRMALVAVDPRTGRIVAWNGYQQERAGFDYASAWQNPGSLYMAFDLVALLHQGKGLGEVYDGTSPRKFGENCDKADAMCSTISNFENTGECGKQCTVAKAMELSANTVFADIAHNVVGLKAVARAAIEAGIPSEVGPRKIPLEGSGRDPLNLNIAIGGAAYQARPVDIAGAYATFAANGVRRIPHLVAKVTDPANNNGVVLDQDVYASGGNLAFAPTDPAVNGMIARNVTEALLPAAAPFPCAEGRPCAGKPGLHGCFPIPGKSKKTDHCSGWMAGYTPQISTAVWLGTDSDIPVQDNAGAPLGGTLPGQTWQKFMNEYLKGEPVEQFPPYVPIGKAP